MTVSKENILNQIYQLPAGEILLFRTVSCEQNRQIFIVTPVLNTYKTFNICVIESSNGNYMKYENCNIIFTEVNNNIPHWINDSNKRIIAKITEKHGTLYSDMIAETKRPIDLASIQIITDNSFEDVIKSEIDCCLKKVQDEKRKKEGYKQYNCIEQSMRQLVTGNLKVDSKHVCYRSSSLGSKNSYESFYEYNSQTLEFKLGLIELIKMLNVCVVHYNFLIPEEKWLALIFNYERLTKILKKRSFQELDAAIASLEAIAKQLGEYYLAFLKFLLEHNIDFSNDEFNYQRTWQKNGFGNDYDYVLTITEPIMELADSIDQFLLKVLGEDASQQFSDEVNGLLENLDNKQLLKNKSS